MRPGIHAIHHALAVVEPLVVELVRGIIAIQPDPPSLRGDGLEALTEIMETVAEKFPE